MINFGNPDKVAFHDVGKYGIPQIDPVTEYPQGEFIPVNYAMTAKHPEDKIVHTFVDDRKFPAVYSDVLRRGIILSWYEIIRWCGQRRSARFRASR